SAGSAAELTARLISTTDALTGTTQNQYDAAGNTTVITAGAPGALVQVETRGYDAWNRGISATVGGQSTQTGYDANGNGETVQHHNGDVTLSRYDYAEQPIEVDTGVAPGNIPSFASSTMYDLAGNATSEIDADGRWHQPLFDADSREVSSTDSIVQQA